MKKIIHVLTQKVCNLPQTEQENHWGLGDLLRGTQSLFEYCKKRGYEFELDISNHPIADFFELRPKNYNFSIDSERISFESFKSESEMEIFINKKFEHEDTIYFMTHGVGVWPKKLTKECKQFIRHAFTPNKESEHLINLKIPDEKNFEILHFRLGDKYLVEGCNDSFDSIFNLAVKNAKKNDFLISDSLEFKNFVSQHSSVKIFEGKPGHTGLLSDSAALRDTLIEFMIATKSKKIKTYSSYNWTSGFALAINRIYDVPLLDLRGSRIWRALERRIISSIGR